MNKVMPIWPHCLRIYDVTGLTRRWQTTSLTDATDRQKDQFLPVSHMTPLDSHLWHLSSHTDDTLVYNRLVWSRLLDTLVVEHGVVYVVNREIEFEIVYVVVYTKLGQNGLIQDRSGTFYVICCHCVFIAFWLGVSNWT